MLKQYKSLIVGLVIMFAVCAISVGAYEGTLEDKIADSVATKLVAELMGTELGAFIDDSQVTRFTDVEITNELVVDNQLADTTVSFGGTNDGKLCLYNGSNFSIISFADNSTTVVTATSTTCE